METEVDEDKINEGRGRNGGSREQEEGKPFWNNVWVLYRTPASSCFRLSLGIPLRAAALKEDGDKLQVTSKHGRKHQ